MAIKSWILVVMVVAVLPFTLPTEAQRRKPTIEIPFHIDRQPPPETLSDLIGGVDLAAYVRILSSEPRRRAFPEGAGSFPETVFVAEILERGRTRRAAKAGEKLRIVQNGGEFEESDRIERRFEESNPPLVVGRSYLVAINWNEYLNAYVFAYGPDSIFELERGKVQPRGKGRGARELTGQDLKEALRRIK